MRKLRICPRPSGLRRWVSVCLLVMLAVFLLGASADHCSDGPSGHAEPQHLLCLDDCAPALIPTAPVPPPPDPMPRIAYLQFPERPIPSLEREPEKAPPRKA